MPIEGLGWTFDTVAEDYDHYRPTSPQELYDDILTYHPAAAGSHALEIGAGTGQEALWEEIQRSYRRFMPPKANPPDTARRYDEAAAARRSAMAAQYGFTDVTTRVYYRELHYSGDEYARRLSNESDKIALAAQARAGLLADIAAAVDRHGGTIVVRDMIDLNLARKPE